MKKINRKDFTSTGTSRQEEVNARLVNAKNATKEELFKTYNSSDRGIEHNEVEAARERYGSNNITQGKKISFIKRLYEAFVNPFTAILFVLALVSAFTDIILAEPGQSDPMALIIITTMVLISGVLRFIQETRSGNAAENLLKMIKTTTNIHRKEIGSKELPIEEVVVGDIIHLSAGDMVPADLRILQAKDLFISQASLTGESEPVEKYNEVPTQQYDALTEVPNLAFMGSNVISGSAFGIVIAVGDDTIFGEMAQTVTEKPDKTTFEKGVNSVSWVLIRFMLVMVPIVLFINGFTKGDWMEASLFALAVAVGLTPEMLPMFVTTCLAKGAVAMSKEKTIIKNLNSIQNLGSMNILCTDKTGTLTQDKVVLMYHLNIDGKEDARVLKHAFLNSYYQTGCSQVEYEGNIVPLSSEMRTHILSQVEKLNDDGMRVIALAKKLNPSPINTLSINDESDMILMGYLSFLDPPKESTAKAIKALNKYGVEVKILTGDNDRVTRSVCKQVGLPVNRIVLGTDIDQMNEQQLESTAKEVSVFAKLSPQQKSRIVRALRNSGNSIGYMGDGINDAAAMKASDVGISVDTAVDIAKESADVILLEKDLMVLEKGIIEGRKTYANMIKYIKMTASSNFGNMFSVLAASAFLPFIPMLSIHIILLNLIYDFSCTAIPWDNVDDEYLVVPRKWDASSVSKFMLWIGPTSSVFDITTYLLMFFVICPATFGDFSTLTPGSPAYLGFIALFHTGWFVESMWTQTLVIHMIRTPKIPFIQSRASASLTLLTFSGIVGLTLIPFSPFGTSIGLTPLPMVFFLWLLLTVVFYMLLVTLFKKIFIKRYGELL